MQESVEVAGLREHYESMMRVYILLYFDLYTYISHLILHVFYW